MSYFDQLSLAGIRSFGPNEDDAGAIKFSAPLTLILGANGCGKTTLIEALKFACCGELPPDTGKGSSFIYDPKLTNCAETKAYVSLRLRDVTGQWMQVKRIMTCTQKQKTQEFKRKDQTLSRLNKKGEWVSAQHKCVDVDAEMSIALGVSKAVLGNVLLCHQEDSNWPLAGDSKVKEKFDLIFGSMKYNKCLNHIRDLRKKIMDDIKIMKTDLLYLKEYKKEASEKRTRISDAEDRIDKTQEEINIMKEKLLPIQKRLSELFEAEKNLSRLYTERETLKTKLEGVKNSIKDLKHNISEEFKGTDGELNHTIENFNAELRKKEDAIDNLEREIEEVNTDIERNIEVIGNEKIKIGQLSRDLENHKERINSRNATLIRICDKIDLNTSLSELSQGREVERILSSLEDLVSKRLGELRKLQEDQKEELAKLQTELDKCRDGRAKLEQSIENKHAAIRSNKEELQKVKNDIQEVDQSTQLLNQLEGKLDRVRRELDVLEKSNQIETCENEIKTAETDRSKYEEELSGVDEKVQQLQLLSSEQAKLDCLRKSKSAADAETTKLKNRHGGTLKHLLGDIPDIGIKMQLDALLDKVSDQIRTKRKEIKLKESEIIGFESERKHLLEKVKNLKQNLESDEFTISQACEGRDFEEYLKEVSSSVDELQVEKGTLSASQIMSRRYIERLKQKSPCCPLCQRGFSKVDEISTLIEELQLKVKEVPSRMRTNKDKLDDLEKKKEYLLQLKPKYEKLSVIKFSELPSLEEELAKIEKKLGFAKEVLSKLQSELEQPEADESLAKTIQSDVVLLEQHLAESRRYARDIQKIEAALPKGNTQSLEEAIEEQKELKERVLSARTIFEEKQKLRNSLVEKRNKLQEEKNSIQNQQLKISGNSQMRSQLVERREELESVEVMLQMELDKASVDLEAQSRQLDLLVRQKRSLEASHATALEEERQKVRKLEGDFEDIKSQQKRINEFESLGGKRKLEQAQQSLSSLEANGDELQIKKMQLNDECTSLKKYISAQAVRQRELDDNLKLRQKRTEEKELSDKITAMEFKLGDLDYQRMNSEKKYLKEDEENCYANVYKLEGGLRELESNLKNMKNDLNKDIYKNADKNYRDKLIDYEVSIQTSEDLNKYYVAFDSALVSYHQDRMQHINKVIRELWKRIYQGNDIDTIEIKTEQEAAASADKKKVYNYRVVQVKNGTELDMKGRCSAGQKVLASLIIRMALAETFSSKCGVLALDEPTTNLDHQNIVNLCKALEELVSSHSHRRNFQLIVITHDKEFLNVLTRIDMIDYYYELSRNAEGKSIVTKVNLDE